jgi:hypothetical protein
MIAGSSQLGWTNIYGEQVYGLILERKKYEEMKKEKDKLSEMKRNEYECEKANSRVLLFLPVFLNFFLSCDIWVSLISC